MDGPVLRRRTGAAAGTYASIVLGFLATLVAARMFSTAGLGLYTIVISSAGFFQTLLDLTIEEALIKFGFRYISREDWGRLRRLFRRTFVFKALGATLAGGALGIWRCITQSSVATGVVSLRGALTPMLLGMVSTVSQVGYFRVAQSPQTGFNAVSAPIRLVLLADQTRDWERGRSDRVFAGVRRYTLLAALG